MSDRNFKYVIPNCTPNATLTVEYLPYEHRDNPERQRENAVHFEFEVEWVNDGKNRIVNDHLVSLNIFEDIWGFYLDSMRDGYGVMPGRMTAVVTDHNDVLRSETVHIRRLGSVSWTYSEIRDRDTLADFDSDHGGYDVEEFETFPIGKDESEVYGGVYFHDSLPTYDELYGD